MPTWTRLKNGLLNAALLALGFGVLVLLYALVTRTTTPRTDPTRTQTSTQLVGDYIQVEVRNGAGVDQLAAQTTAFLRDRGFDVVEMGNYSSFSRERSVVIDRVGDLEAARKVARALGLSDDRVEQDVRTNLYLDASVIIGHDYRQLRPFASTE